MPGIRVLLVSRFPKLMGSTDGTTQRYRNDTTRRNTLPKFSSRDELRKMSRDFIEIEDIEKTSDDNDRHTTYLTTKASRNTDAITVQTDEIQLSDAIQTSNSNIDRVPSRNFSRPASRWKAESLEPT